MQRLEKRHIDPEAPKSRAQSQGCAHGRLTDACGRSGELLYLTVFLLNRIIMHQMLINATKQ